LVVAEGVGVAAGVAGEVSARADGAANRIIANRQATAIDNARTKMDVHVRYGILVPPKCAVWRKHRMIAAYESSSPPAQNPTSSTPDSHR
jgi:hypothetical protein